MYPGLERVKKAAGKAFIFSIENESVSNREIKFLKESEPSGLIFFKRNIENENSLKNIITAVKQNSEVSLFSIDEEGGRVKRLPTNEISLPSASKLSDFDDSTIIERVSKHAKRLSSIGINLNMAPTVDIRSGEDNSIIGDRSFSDDPKIIAQKASLYIAAQKRFNIHSVIKHFPGHGSTIVDSHKELPLINKSFNELMNSDIKPFISLKSKISFLMVAHLLVKEVDMLPASLSGKWSDILRNKVNYTGVTILDDIEMFALDKYSPLEKIELFLNTSYDLIPICSGDEQTMISLWEAMIKSIEKKKYLLDRFEKSGKNISNLVYTK